MESDKVMFEIYREPDFNRAYRVVYFTELGEHNKEYEINRALAGEHFYEALSAITARTTPRRSFKSCWNG